jgi:hypothetical protein
MFSLFFLYSLLHSIAAEEFVLDSELKMLFHPDTSSFFLTKYSYDSQGNRIEKSVYNDSTRLSITRFIYNPGTFQLLREVLINGDDTLTISKRSYNNHENLICIKVFAADGAENYRDSITYDDDGICTAITRYSGNAILFRHIFSYNKRGWKQTDTLLEPNGKTFSARQATIFIYDTDGRVTGEFSSRYMQGNWYPFNAIIMSYNNNMLTAVTKYDGDGSLYRLVDSVAMFFDEFGNRIQEQQYNNQRVLIRITEFKWKEMLASIRSVFNEECYHKIKASNREVRLLSNINGVLSIYNLDGKLQYRRTINQTDQKINRIVMPVIRPGYYTALFVSGRNKFIKSFIISR